MTQPAANKRDNRGGDHGHYFAIAFHNDLLVGLLVHSHLGGLVQHGCTDDLSAQNCAASADSNAACCAILLSATTGLAGQSRHQISSVSTPRNSLRRYRRVALQGLASYRCNRRSKIPFRAGDLECVVGNRRPSLRPWHLHPASLHARRAGRTPPLQVATRRSLRQVPSRVARAGDALKRLGIWMCVMSWLAPVNSGSCRHGKHFEAGSPTDYPQVSKSVGQCLHCPNGSEASPTTSRTRSASIVCSCAIALSVTTRAASIV